MLNTLETKIEIKLQKTTLSHLTCLPEAKKEEQPTRKLLKE